MAANDSFDILGLEPTFALDLELLERRHRELSRALHPDHHAAGGAAERRLALGKAIEVNEAFRALRDPVRRAEILLQRRGIQTGETHEPKADPELLMEIMEKREALGDARRARDLDALHRLGAEVRARESATRQALLTDFASSGEASE
ncbi:MAG TPA: Fe-S protein assembly co-chaperone HscB, partial [Polyangiaceae bacterium]